MLTADEVTANRATQESSMMDRCKIMTPANVSGDYGQEAMTYSDGSELVCGFEPASSQRSGSIAGVVVELYARLRMKSSDAVSLTPNHRIKITSRTGAALATAEVYQMIGYHRQGPTATVIDLQRVSA